MKRFLGFCIFLLANGLTCGYADAQLQNGLVGYWSFNEGTEIVAMDSSGNGNTGALLNGPVWSSGKSGLALAFDGANDYVEVPHGQSLNLSTALTVSVWINNEALTNSGLSQNQYRIIASKGWPPDDGSWSLAWRANDGALFFFVGRDASYRFAGFSYDNSQAAAWHLVTAVLDNGKISLYQDGVLKAGPVGIDSSAIRTDTSPLRVGSLGASSISIRNWDGLVDELRLYNRALSAAEIAALYQQDNQSFNFSLANSMNLSAIQGSSATNTITASLVSGSPQPVSFSLSGLPEGASGSFSKTTCTATCSSLLTIATATSTPAGTYTLTVTGTGGGLNKTTSFSLTVTSTPSTTITITSPVQGTTFTPGQTVTATGSGTNLLWSIDLIGDELPSFKTGAGSNITFTVPSSANSSQVIRITLTGTGGSATRDYAIAASGSTPAFNFSLSNSGNSSVTAGSSMTNKINATLLSGSAQTVTYSVAGLPSGSTASFSSASCSPTCSSTLTINTSVSTPGGSSTISVTATGGGVTKTTAFGLTVSAPTAPAQLTLTWRDNSNNEDSFAVERKTGTTGTYSQMTMTAMNVTSYIDSSVNRGVTYCYRVQAVNSAGASAYTNDACKTVP